MNKRILLRALVLIFLGTLGAAADEVIVGNFSHLEPGQGLPAAWEKLAFASIERQTAYSVVFDHDRSVIKAVSDAAASGLIQHYRGSAQRTPWLSWQWKIDHVLKNGDVSKKQGDDYAARIYLAFEFNPAGQSLWQRMRHKIASLAAGRKLPGSAINYIWANKAPKGKVVNSPYTDLTKMFVLQSGNSFAGQWMTERRNIVDDYQVAFGTKPPPIIGIAIMTDTDNTGEATIAYYADIRLRDDR